MNNLPEAAKSATVKVISPSGFHWLCTVRGDENTALLDKMLRFEETVLAANFTPEKPYQKPISDVQAMAQAKAPPPSGSKPAKCEECGADAIERWGTKKNGQPYHAIFCSTEDQSHAQWIKAK